MPIMTFRDAILRIIPPRFRQGVAQKLFYSLAIHLDLLEAQAVWGVKARFPGTAPYDALPLIGRDRRITRGFAEPTASYAARLRRWWDDHKIAGSAYSILQQVRGYLTPYTPMMRIVNQHGTWYTLNAAGEFSVVKNQGNWDWDGRGSELWSRFWLIIYVTGSPWSDAPLWSDFSWGDGTRWGTTMDDNQADTIRKIIQQFKGAHEQCAYIILANNPNSFSPTAAPGGTGMPNGTWGQWSKTVLGIAMPARLTTARYIRGE